MIFIAGDSGSAAVSCVPCYTCEACRASLFGVLHVTCHVIFFSIGQQLLRFSVTLCVAKTTPVCHRLPPLSEGGGGRGGTFSPRPSLKSTTQRNQQSNLFSVFRCQLLPSRNQIIGFTSKASTFSMQIFGYEFVSLEVLAVRFPIEFVMLQAPLNLRELYFIYKWYHFNLLIILFVAIWLNMRLLICSCILNVGIYF